MKDVSFIYRANQGWHSGVITCLPPMCPGLDSQTQHLMWVEFVVGSRSCSSGFWSKSSVFPLSSKTIFSEFQFDLEFEGHRFVSLVSVKCYSH